MKTIISTVFLLLLLAGTVSAQVTFTDNEAQFLANNPDLMFQDFSAANAPEDAFIQCVEPVDQNSNDLCFSPGDILPGITIFTFPPDPDGLAVIGANRFGDPSPPNLLANRFSFGDMDIQFSQPVTAVGMTIGCVDNGGCTSTSDVTVYSGDIVTGTTNVNVSNLTDTFVGIKSSGPITRVTIEELDPPFTSQFGTLRDIRFGGSINIPTLSEWGLIATAAVLGFIGFIAIRRRKATA